MSARGIDEAVTQLFLSAASPAKIEIALQALEELEANRQETRRQWDLQLERADYEVELASRRYEAVDPSNRLVAAELEAQWETALRQRERLRTERAEWERRLDQPLSQQDRRLVQELSRDLERVWRAETTSMEERKTLLRFLVKRVHLRGQDSHQRGMAHGRTKRVDHRPPAGRCLGAQDFRHGSAPYPRTPPRPRLRHDRSHPERRRIAQRQGLALQLPSRRLCGPQSRLESDDEPSCRAADGEKLSPVLYDEG
jgi:hypothetical protein